jgi:hypothetical protein
MRQILTHQVSCKIYSQHNEEKSKMKWSAKAPPHWLVWLLIGSLTGTTATPYAVAQSTKPSQMESSDVQANSKSQGTVLLHDALRLYEELEWERADEKLKAALATGLDGHNRAEAYWYLAVLARANDDFKAAEDYLVELLRAKPDFVLAETLIGTDFEPLFEAALARTDRTPPQLKLLPLKDVQRNQPISVVAEISDASPIVQVALSYQSPEAGAETVVPMEKGRANRWSGEVPGTVTQTPGELLLRVSAQDEWQNISTQSETVVISKGGGGGIFYLIGGAIVAVGGGVAALVLGGSGGDAGGADDDDDDDTTPPSSSWPKSASPEPPQSAQ